MNNEQVTLSLNPELLQKAQRLARQENMTVAALLDRVLTDLVDAEAAAASTRQRQMRLMRKRLDMGRAPAPVVEWDNLYEQ